MIGKQLVEFSDAFSWDHSVRIPSEVGESDRSFDLSARRTSKSRAVHRERLRSHGHDLCDLGWLEAAFVDADFISVAVSPTGLVCCDLPQSVNGGRIPRSMPRIHLWERALSVGFHLLRDHRKRCSSWRTRRQSWRWFRDPCCNLPVVKSPIVLVSKCLD